MAPDVYICCCSSLHSSRVCHPRSSVRCLHRWGGDITVLLFVSIQLYSLLLRLLLRLLVPQSCRHMDPTQYSPCIVQGLCTLRLHSLKSLRRRWNRLRSITRRLLYFGTSTSTWKHLPFRLLSPFIGF